jgi:hypothetical protein
MREEKCIQNLVGKLEKKRPFGVHVRKTLKWIIKKWGGGVVEWINLAQGRVQWRTL